MIDSCDSSRTHRRNPLEMKLELTEEDLTLGYNFPSVRRHVHVEPDPLVFTPQTPRHGYARKYEKIKPYTFTDETVSFVKQQASLLASLVCLLCPPESIKPTPTLEHPSEESESVEAEKGDARLQDEGKMALMQSLHLMRGGRPRPALLKRTNSVSDEAKLAIIAPTPVWQEAFNKVLTLFPEKSPLHKFLLMRLGCFKGLLPWDRKIQETSGDGESQNPFINLRVLAVVPGRSLELGHACEFTVRKLLRRAMVPESLRFLKSEPVINNTSAVMFLKDMVLSGALLEATKEDGKHGSKQVKEAEFRDHDPLVYVYQLSDMELAARLAISLFEKWPISVCVNVLMYISYHLSPHSPFLPEITSHLNRLYVYNKIIQSVEAPPIGRRDTSRQSPWRHWSLLAFDSRERSDYVVEVLLKSKDYNLAREWVSVHGLGEDMIKVGCLIHVL